MYKKELEEKLLEQLISLEKKSSKLPPLSKEEQLIIEADNNFESVYFSNKLEGNKLTKEEAKNAIFAGDL